MCGIAGVVGFGDEALARRMCGRIKHRGPDDEGYYDDPTGRAHLGMTRLSVIDVAGGRQPMTDERGRYWLVFNGEIYNHRELRTELEAKGHRFTSRADTEVIVHLYEERGPECVESLNGDFAFAIWDSVEQRLMLARDRLGVKPLYIWRAENRLAFASELKALLELPEISKELDPAAIDAYLTFLYIPSPRTIFRGVEKLPAGSWLLWHQGQSRIERYWEPPAPSRGPWESDRELAARVREELEAAVRRRLMSDVPLGAFLSGGIDSSAVVAMMSRASDRPIKTFAIGFEDADRYYDERPAARVVAQRFGTEHRELVVKPDLADLLPRVVEQMDEPFADSSAMLTYLISREAKRTVTVALTGIGGDEVFGGYPRYLAARMSGTLAGIPSWAWAGVAAGLRGVPERRTSHNIIGRLKRFAEGFAEPRDRRYLAWVSHATPEIKHRLYTDELRGRLAGPEVYAPYRAGFSGGPGDDADRANAFDLRVYLPDDLLVMGDKMSMAHGLEVRVPFCDHRLVELAASIPMRERMAGRRLKALLKRALTGVIPDEIMNKPKQGFMLPLSAWLRGPLAPMCRELLQPAALARRGLFRPDGVAELIARHDHGQAYSAHLLYALMVFELWCRRYID